jgi:hypothetical protein
MPANECSTAPVATRTNSSGSKISRTARNANSASSLAGRRWCRRSPNTSPQIADAMEDPGLFGPWFPGASWDGWRIILKAAFGLPLAEHEREFFRTVAKRNPPTRRVKELWVISGRRAGKDSVASLIGAFTAALFDGGHVLRPGERPLVGCWAVDRDQSGIVLAYMRRMFSDIPMLRQMVVRETQDGFQLSNGVDVVVSTNSYRAARGRTVLCAIFDEVAFWRSEQTATPDLETYRAVKPSMATLASSAMLVGISSPHSKSGLLYERFKKFFGREDDNVLVIKAPTAVLNPSLDASIIAAALEDDPVAARADWLGEFRDDICGFADIALIEAAVDRGVTVRPPVRGIRYTSFCDPSGGARDSFTVAICHAEQNVAVLDCLVEIKAPFNSIAATEQMSSVLKSYFLHHTTGDKYAAAWVVDAFQKCGIKYEHSERDRSALYLDALPLFTAGRARLLDNKRLVAQFSSLERRTSPIGKDRVDHGPGGHDDLCNPAAGAMVLATAGRRPISGEQWGEVARLAQQFPSGMWKAGMDPRRDNRGPRSWIAQPPSHFERNNS